MFSHLFNTYEAVTPPPKSKQDFKQEIYQEPDSDTLIIDPLGLGPISRVPSVDKPSDQPFVPESQFDFEPDEVQDTSEYSTNNQLISNIINTGRSLIGNKYKYGGINPDTGLDCSAFLQYIFKQNGVDIPRDTSGIFKAGKEVSLSNVQPGDIICSRGSGPSGRHVQMVSRIDPESNQIYVIEAKGKDHGIVEGPLTKKRSDIYSVRRIIKNPNKDPFLSNQDIQNPTKITTFSSKKDFTNTMYSYLYKALEDNGIDAKTWAPILTTHTSIESGWGNEFSRKNNNYGGIKGKGSGRVKTKEWSPERGYYTINDSFRSFKSIQEFADAYVKMLKNKFKAFEGTPDKYLANIRRHGYFTARLQDYKNIFDSRLKIINSLLS